jgi:uncharacterized RDD family membrane protein YckC
MMDQTISQVRDSSNQRCPLQIASLLRRLAAGAVDACVLVFLVGPLVVAANGFNSVQLMAFGLLVLFAYKPVLEGLYSTTLGKIALGIRLSTIDGKDLTMNDSIRRNTLYIIPAFGVVAVFALIQGGVNVLDQTELLAILSWERKFLFPLSVNGIVWSLVGFFTIWSAIVAYDLTSVVGGEGYRSLHDLLGGTICIWQPKTATSESVRRVRSTT